MLCYGHGPCHVGEQIGTLMPGKCNSQLFCLLLFLLFGLCSCGGSNSSGSGGTLSPSFSISVSPQSQSLGVGEGASLNLTVHALNGFSQMIQVSVNGLPGGVTTSPASPFSMTTSGQSVTLTASSSAAIGSATITFDNIRRHQWQSGIFGPSHDFDHPGNFWRAFQQEYLRPHGRHAPGRRLRSKAPVNLRQCGRSQLRGCNPHGFPAGFEMHSGVRSAWSESQRRRDASACRHRGRSRRLG